MRNRIILIAARFSVIVIGFLHSSAYRRLSGKMQVFTGEMGDYHRTRLTHTQEVATIARTIGRTLGLNEDLIEAFGVGARYWPSALWSRR